MKIYRFYKTEYGYHALWEYTGNNAVWMCIASTLSSIIGRFDILPACSYGNVQIMEFKAASRRSTR